MKRSRIAQCILISLACVTLAGCGEDTPDAPEQMDFAIDQPLERGPLGAHVRVEKSEMTIADTIWLELQAWTEPQYEVTMPNVGEILQNFGIVDWRNLGRRLDPNDNVLTTYRYRLEPFLSGKYELPSFTFHFQDVNDPNQTYELNSDPIEIEVASLLGEDRENLEIAEIEGVVAMPEQRSLWWVWLIPAAGVIAAVALWFVFRRRRKAEQTRIFRPAHEIAYARLRALVKDDLLEQGRIKEFYERISSILRHYIEDRFELRAPERTTEEFLIELKYTDALSDSRKKDVENFLTLCDLVKFARHAPTADQIQQTFDVVKGFIEKTRSDQRMIDVTDKIEQDKTVTAEAE